MLLVVDLRPPFDPFTFRPSMRVVSIDRLSDDEAAALL
jgi:hypothetical protein